MTPLGDKSVSEKRMRQLENCKKPLIPSMTHRQTMPSAPQLSSTAPVSRCECKCSERRCDNGSTFSVAKLYNKVFSGASNLLAEDPFAIGFLICAIFMTWFATTMLHEVSPSFYECLRPAAMWDDDLLKYPKAKFSLLIYYMASVIGLSSLLLEFVWVVGYGGPDDIPVYLCHGFPTK